MARTLPLVSSKEVEKHNSKKSCWVTLYDRKVYDVTNFLNEHPAGGDLILPYAGKDVTKIMADSVSHEHSESAYEMLDDGMLVGYLATAAEENDLLNNKNKTAVEVKLSNSEDSDIYEFHDKLPAAEKMSIQTDYDDDIKKHKFLDLNKPLLMQVLFGGFSKDFYLDQVHRPRHYGKGSAPLLSLIPTSTESNSAFATTTSTTTVSVPTDVTSTATSAENTYITAEGSADLTSAVCSSFPGKVQPIESEFGYVEIGDQRVQREFEQD